VDRGGWGFEGVRGRGGYVICPFEYMYDPLLREFDLCSKKPEKKMMVEGFKEYTAPGIC